ncbi:hypothetical protein [Bradyrhizobium sp.]|uniref:hypothetical protein n=1 Tax=Bradyrhizobium sp. TaxID=376 RepID=UPI003C37B88E
MRFTMKPDLPESGRMRRYYEGAVVPLVAFYQEGMDHHDGEDRRKVREWLNQEFNGEMVNIDGKMQGVGRSTKGREHLQPFLERVLDWLNENYNPPSEALDPEKYKNWRDTIFPDGGPTTYIDYLIETGILRTV